MPNFIKTTTRTHIGTPTFWAFHQNNSGGYFEDELPMFLIVEATSYGQANAIAESLGVDFQDSNTFSGDRWSRQMYYSDSTSAPVLYGEDVEKFIAETKYLCHPYLAAIVRLNGETTHYHKA